MLLDRKTNILTIILIFALCFYFNGNCFSQSHLSTETQAGQQPRATTIKFENGMWFDGKSFQKIAVYSVNGKFELDYDGRVDNSTDLEGSYVIPPFADAHQHVLAHGQHSVNEIQEYLSAGIFYVKNPNNIAAMADATRPLLNIPTSVDVSFAHGGITKSDGHPIQIYQSFIGHDILSGWTMEDLKGQAYYVVDNHEDLEREWPKIVEKKPDFLKIYLEWSENYSNTRAPERMKNRGLNPGLVPAILKKAKSDGFAVTAHVKSAHDFHVAVSFGVNEIAHLPVERINEQDAMLAAQKNIVVVTTTVSHGNPAPGKEIDEIHRANLELLNEHGVVIAIGTDSHETNVLDEVRNLRRLAVFNDATLLRIWTETTPTTIFRSRKIGRIESGYEASFLVLNANPLKDFDAVFDVKLRFKQGRFITPVKSNNQSERTIVPHKHPGTGNSENTNHDDQVSSWAKAKEARQLIDREQWDRASALYREVVKENPYRANSWYNLGFSLQQHGQQTKAIQAYQESLKLGFMKPECMYNIARSYALNKQTPKALEWLKRADAEGYLQERSEWDDPAFDNIKSDPVFLALSGIGADPELDRIKKWTLDIDFLARQIERLHYDPFVLLARKDFLAQVNKLKSAVSQLTDQGIECEIRKLLASIGDGHTLLVNDIPAVVGAGHGGFGHASESYPIDLYVFDDGLFVRAASEEYADFVGAKVMKVGNIGVSDLFAMIEPFCSVDNKMGLKLWAPYFVTQESMMAHLGVVEGETLDLTVQAKDGRTLVAKLRPRPSGNRDGWIDSSIDDLPLYLKQSAKPYWYKLLPNSQTVYFQFNSVRDGRETTFEEFCNEMFSFCSDNKVDSMIIDLRNNPGGNKQLNKHLIRGLLATPELNRVDGLFVIIGRRTFSAAMCCAVELEQQTNAVFVGEPTGSKPNFIGELSTFSLPYCALQVSCSTEYHQNSSSSDQRVWVAPHLPAPLKSQDYFVGRDPAMTAIIEHMHSK